MKKLFKSSFSGASSSLSSLGNLGKSKSKEVKKDDKKEEKKEEKPQQTTSTTPPPATTNTAATPAEANAPPATTTTTTTPPTASPKKTTPNAKPSAAKRSNSVGASSSSPPASTGTPTTPTGEIFKDKPLESSGQEATYVQVLCLDQAKKGSAEWWVNIGLSPGDKVKTTKIKANSKSTFITWHDAKEPTGVLADESKKKPTKVSIALEKKRIFGNPKVANWDVDLKEVPVFGTPYADDTIIRAFEIPKKKNCKLYVAICRLKPVQGKFLPWKQWEIMEPLLCDKYPSSPNYGKVQPGSLIDLLVPLPDGKILAKNKYGLMLFTLGGDGTITDSKRMHPYELLEVTWNGDKMSIKTLNGTIEIAAPEDVLLQFATFITESMQKYWPASDFKVQGSSASKIPSKEKGADAKQLTEEDVIQFEDEYLKFVGNQSKDAVIANGKAFLDALKTTDLDFSIYAKDKASLEFIARIFMQLKPKILGAQSQPKVLKMNGGDLSGLGANAYLLTSMSQVLGQLKWESITMVRFPNTLASVIGSFNYKYPNLHSIDLEGSSVPAKDVAALLGNIKQVKFLGMNGLFTKKGTNQDILNCMQKMNLSGLLTITLSSNQFADDEASILNGVLAKARALELIQFSAVQVKFGLVFKGIKMPNLKNLVMAGNSFSEDDATGLAEYLSSLKIMVTLTESNGNPKAIRAILKAVKSPNKTLGFDIRNSPALSREAWPFASGDFSDVGFATLNVDDMCIGGKALGGILGDLASAKPSNALVNIQAARNVDSGIDKAGDYEFFHAAFAKAMKQNAPIKLLSLTGDFRKRLLGPGLISAIQQLPNTKNLTYLDISGNNFGDKAGVELGKALRKNRSLVTLLIDDNGLGIESFVSIRGCLYGNQKLSNMPFPQQDFQREINRFLTEMQAGVATELQGKSIMKMGYKMRNEHQKTQGLEQLKQGKRAQGAAKRAKEKLEKIANDMKKDLQRNVGVFQKKQAEFNAKMAVKLKEKEKEMEAKKAAKAKEQEEKKKKQAAEKAKKDAEKKKALEAKKAAAKKTPAKKAGAPAKPGAKKTGVAKKAPAKKAAPKKAAAKKAPAKKGPAKKAAPKKKPVKKGKKPKGNKDEEHEGKEEEENKEDEENKEEGEEKEEEGEGSSESSESEEEGEDEQEEEEAGEEEEAAAEEEEPAEEEPAEEEPAEEEPAEEEGGEEEAVDAYGSAGPRDLEDGDEDPEQEVPPVSAEIIEELRVISDRESEQAAGTSNDNATFIEEVSLPYLDEMEKWDNVKTFINKQWNEAMIKYYAENYDFDTPNYFTIQVFNSALPRNNKDITIVTQCSMDRLCNLERMALNWNGVISACVYVDDENKQVDAEKEIMKLCQKIEALNQCRLDVSILVELDPLESEPLYPINSLRNAALDQAKTDLVFLLDIDFVPSQNLHDDLTSNDADYAEMLVNATESKRALVVPAFETKSATASFPSTKQELKKMFDSDEIEGFHISTFPKGHSPTNYTKWFGESSDGYSVRYSLYYEPYVICSRKHIPRYDERFVGYGLNKIVHLLQMHRMEFSFYVLPSAFVVALPHAKSSSWKHTFGRGRDENIKMRLTALFIKTKKEFNVQYPDTASY